MMRDGQATAELERSGYRGRSGIMLDPTHAYDEIDSLPISLGSWTIGSSPESDLRLNVEGVAPHHCTVIVGKHRTIVKAWSPLTWINDGAVREALLRIGDRLIIGPVEFRIRPNETNDTASVDRASTQYSPPSIDLLLEQARTSRTEPRSSSPRDVQGDVHGAPSGRLTPSTASRNALADYEASLNERTWMLDRRESLLLESVQELQGLVEEHHRSAEQIQNERSELEQVQCDLLQRQQDIDHLRDDVLAQRSDVTAERTSWVEAREQVERERFELEHRRALADEALAETERQTREVQQREAALQAWEAELTEWAALLDEKSNESERMAATLREERRSLQQDATELAAQQALVKEERSSLLVDREKLEEREQSVEEREAALLETQQVCEERESELRRKSNDLEERHAEIAATEQKLITRSTDLDERESTLREQVTALETHRAAQEQQAQAIAKRAEEIDARAAELTAMSESLAAKESELTEQRATLEQESQQLLQDRDELNEREHSLGVRAEELDVRERELATQATELESQRSECAALAERLDRERLEIDQQRQEVEDQRGTLDERERELEQSWAEVRSERAELESRHRELVAEQERLDVETERQAEESQRLESNRAELDAIREQVAAEREQLAEKAQHHDSETARLEEEWSRLEAAQLSLDERRASLGVQESEAVSVANSQLDAERAEVVEQQKRCEQLSDELRGQREQLEYQRQEFDEKVARFERKQQEILDSLNSQRAAWEAERDAPGDLGDAETATTGEVDRHLAAERERLDIREEKLNQWADQLTESEESIKSERARIQEEAGKLQDVRRSLEQMRADAERQQTELSERSSDVEAQYQDIESQRQSLDDLSAALRGREHELDEREQELAARREELVREQEALAARADELDAWAASQRDVPADAEPSSGEARTADASDYESVIDEDLTPETMMSEPPMTNSLLSPWGGADDSTEMREADEQPAVESRESDATEAEAEHLRSELHRLFGLEETGDQNSPENTSAPGSSFSPDSVDVDEAVDGAGNVATDSDGMLQAESNEPAQAAEARDSENDWVDEEDPVAAYMQRLLARSRGEEPVEEPRPVPVEPKPVATEPEPTHTAVAVDAPRSDDVEGSESQDAASEDVPRRKEPVDKEALRANLDSFRELANMSARKAVAKSASSRLREQKKLYVMWTGLGAVTTCGLLAAYTSTGMGMAMTAAMVTGSGTAFAGLKAALAMWELKHLLQQVQGRDGDEPSLEDHGSPDVATESD